jgi:hypothetical protein
LLCGPVAASVDGGGAAAYSADGEEVARLRAEVDQLKAQLARVMQELGMAP